MSYSKFSCIDYKNQADEERKTVRKIFKFRKSPIDVSKGLENYKWFYMFLIGAINGTLYEEFLTIFMKGYWASRSGVMWLQLNPLYGVGVLAFVIVLARFDKWYHKVTYGAILGGTVEYLAHFFQEVFAGSTSWNYKNAITNIDGRTTVVFAVAWGLMGYALVTFLYPLVLKILRKVPYKAAVTMTKFLKVVVISVIAISFIAVIRCNFANLGMEPFTIIGEFCDKYFPLEYLKKYYVNMKFK